jgi:5-enolpyruvylshikimate-3-phosphate synthase
MELRIKRAPRIDLEITVPGDKSISHRAVIVAALSNGVCTLRGFLPSEDCMHTVNAMRALGIKIEQPEPTTLSFMERNGSSPRQTRKSIAAIRARPCGFCGSAGRTKI